MLSRKFGLIGGLAVAVTLFIGGLPAAASAAPLSFAPEGVSTPRFPIATTPALVELRGADGTAIYARVYRPDTSSDPSWKTPVIVDDGPYFENRENDLSCAYTPSCDPDLAQQLVQHFTPLGYTVVKVEMRGTGRSGGCWDDFGPLSGEDFKIAVDYFGSRKWSNGKVGSWGGSADGTSQQMGAVLAPQHLATIVPLNATSNVYDGRAFDGVPFDGDLQNGTSYWFQDIPGSDGTDAAESSAAHHVREIATRAGCWPPHLSQAEDPLTDERKSTYYQARELRSQVSKIKASVLYYAGLDDQVVLPIAIDGWYDQIPSFKRAIFAQAPHVWPFGSAADWQGAGGDPQYRRNDWWKIFHAWYDYWLLGLPTGVASWPDVQVQDEHNVWHAVSSFAGMGAAQDYPLGAGVIGQAAGPGASESFHEADGATQSLATELQTDGTPARTDGRDPLPALAWNQVQPAPLHLSGQAHLKVKVTLDRPTARFMFALQAISPDGSTTKYLTRGYLAATRRNQASPDAEPVPTGVPVTYTIRSLPFDAWVQKGWTLRLTLAGNDPSRFRQTHPAANSPWFAGIPEGNGFTANLAIDGSSQLQLPIANDTCGLTVDQAQPATAPTPDCPNPASVGA